MKTRLTKHRSSAAGPRSQRTAVGVDSGRASPGPQVSDGALLAREIGAAADYLQRCRQELSALGANELAKHCIPAATRELGDIIEDGAELSHAIMTAAERVMGASHQDIEAYRAFVQEAVTTILVQCAFHDIAAQRAQRIRGALDTIERRLSRLATFVATHDVPDIVDFSTPEATVVSQKAGPAPRGEGNDQAGIDRILATPRTR